MRIERRFTKTQPVMVFGSNAAGIHGKGAALFAKKYRGAQIGVGEGLTGNAYALPTKDRFIVTRPLASIKQSIEVFKQFARDNPDKTFEVTPVGCGLAGYKQGQVKPLFEPLPDNCFFSKEWEV